MVVHETERSIDMDDEFKNTAVEFFKTPGTRMTRLQLARHCDVAVSTITAYLLGYCPMPSHVREKIEALMETARGRVLPQV
jgi:hypothetical protein